jgi:hypothetical protein
VSVAVLSASLAWGSARIMLISSCIDHCQEATRLFSLLYDVELLTYIRRSPARARSPPHSATRSRASRRRMRPRLRVRSAEKGRRVALSGQEPRLGQHRKALLPTDTPAQVFPSPPGYQRIIVGCGFCPTPRSAVVHSVVSCVQPAPPDRALVRLCTYVRALPSAVKGSDTPPHCGFSTHRVCSYDLRFFV